MPHRPRHWTAPSWAQSGRRLTRLALVCFGVVAASGAQAEGAPALKARALAATCAQCHGTEGAPPTQAANPADIRLAGLPKDYLIAQMRAFREGTRPATVMHQIAKGYDAEQIESIAAYFAARR